jgi:hypothetical protein
MGRGWATAFAARRRHISVGPGRTFWHFLQLHGQGPSELVKAEERPDETMDSQRGGDSGSQSSGFAVIPSPPRQRG